MTPQQLHRLEALESVEFLTPFEEAEYACLARLHADMRAAYEMLADQGLRPTWVGGEYIAVGPRIVRSLSDAYRLLGA